MLYFRLLAIWLGLVLAYGMAPAGDTKAEFIDLIKADGLNGWHLVSRPKDKQPASKKSNWEISGGVLTNTSVGRHLATDTKYRDFELEFEFQVPSKCNTGLYLRGRYELKLKDADPLETKPEQRCGAIYNQIAPTSNEFLGPRKWNKCRVVLQDNEITVSLNDKIVIDKKELKGPTGGTFDDKEREPGPIILHSHPAGAGIKYRAMKIKALKED
ncbi:MAG: hypothetical protein RL595_2197 [Planctomycetota bacterium]